MSQANSNNLKNEELNEFAVKYFRKVKSRHHVLHNNYTYVIACNYNKRSFIYCLMDAFQSYKDNEEISSYDYILIIQNLINNFPRSIVMDSILCIEQTSNERLSDNTIITKFIFKDLSSSVYFSIIYDDWIKILQNFFSEEKDSDNQNIHDQNTKMILGLGDHLSLSG
jgi:hypothetical protein